MAHTMLDETTYTVQMCCADMIHVQCTSIWLTLSWSCWCNAMLMHSRMHNMVSQLHTYKCRLSAIHAAFPPGLPSQRVCNAPANLYHTNHTRTARLHQQTRHAVCPTSTTEQAAVPGTPCLITTSAQQHATYATCNCCHRRDTPPHHHISTTACDSCHMFVLPSQGHACLHARPW